MTYSRRSIKAISSFTVELKHPSSFLHTGLPCCYESAYTECSYVSLNSAPRPSSAHNSPNAPSFYFRDLSFRSCCSHFREFFNESYDLNRVALNAIPSICFHNELMAQHCIYSVLVIHKLIPMHPLLDFQECFPTDIHSCKRSHTSLNWRDKNLAEKEMKDLG